MNFFTKRKLKNCNPDEIDFFTLEGKKVYARIDSAYDGDSCTLIIPINKNLKKVKCRLNRIDTAELRTPDPLEKEYAIKARDRLLFFKPEILVASFSEADKYGRYLVDLYTEDELCINNMLVLEGLAYQYDGGTKREFSDWVKDSEHMPRNLTEILRTSHKPEKRAGLFACFRCRS